jgi:hypothetical protein
MRAMPRPRFLVCALLLLGCPEEDPEPAAESGAMVGTTGEPEPWWLGTFHDASLPPGSNATLLFVGNLEVRADGTATGTSLFCEDEPEIAQYSWSMAGDTVTFAGDPLIWQVGEVASIELRAAAACDEIVVTVETLGGEVTDSPYARGASCLQSNGPSCDVEVVWCDAEPPPCG